MLFVELLVEDRNSGRPLTIDSNQKESLVTNNALLTLLEQNRFRCLKIAP